MKKNPLTIAIAVVLAIVFIFLSFSFQVRQTEVAVVSRFGVTRGVIEPGLKFRAPWPIDNVYRFENRTQNFERKFEQTTTRDGKILLITIFIGWRIDKPETYFVSFNGDPTKAEASLEGLVRDAKNGIIGQHIFSDLISPDPKDLKFDQIEGEMLKAIKQKAHDNYGIEVTLLGIKQLGLPETITTKVFERMKAERQVLAQKFQAEGESQAKVIRAEAEQERQKLLTQAEAEAIVIRGKGDEEAAKSFKVMNQNPELATFLMQLDTLEKSLKERTTLILDQQTSPFNLLGNKTFDVPGKTATPNSK